MIRPTLALWMSVAATAIGCNETTTAPGLVASALDCTSTSKKIVICHATSSPSNPYVAISISTAACLGHTSHPGDVLPDANGSCPGPLGCNADPASCDDGNGCTVDSCDPTTGACANVAKSCSDDDACTDDSCDPTTGACANVAKSCNDDDACTDDSCDPTTGACANVAKSCNDDDACTTDSCDPTTGDCANVAKSCNDDDACTNDSCDPNTGACANVAKSCNDDDACTTDSCDPTTGACAFVARSCNDDDACTTDSCDPNTGACANVAKSCSDDDACTNDSCDPTTGACTSKSKCNDGDGCTIDSCDPTTGQCHHALDFCEDDDPCTQDACVNGACRNVPITCDDNDVCTNDTCVNGQCVSRYSCEDDDPCTQEACINGQCVNTTITCDDNSPCTNDACVQGQCVNTPKCDDADPCTTDGCMGDGSCVNVPQDCNDNDPCTVDACSDGQCTHTPLCDDGDPCTYDNCNGGVCSYPALDCGDGNGCTTDVCVDGECTHASRDCDDGNPCTSDSCENHACVNTLDSASGCGFYHGLGDAGVPVTWFEAAAHCESLGYHLVTVQSAAELEAIELLFPAGETLWLGGHRAVRQGRIAQGLPGYVRDDWAWTTDDSFTDFEAWATSEPSGGTDDNCLAFETGDDGWFDSACDAPVYYYVCEDDGRSAFDLDGDGFTWGSGDCDIEVGGTFPGASEICDGFDDDCDGQIDEGFPEVGKHYYLDLDLDGHGLYDVSSHTCDGPSQLGLALAFGDCAPDDPAVHPGAFEACNGIDDDCDGQIDGTLTWYADADGDGVGATASAVGLVCPAVPGAGWVRVGGDCDDTAVGVRPGAIETCNGVDDDCDGEIDESSPAWYVDDFDQDGFGAVANTTCPVPALATFVGGDCADTDPLVYPGAEEICNSSADENCNGLVNEVCDSTPSNASWPHTWSEAVAACGSKHLASASGPEETDRWITWHATTQSPQGLYWIGAVRSFSESRHRADPSYVRDDWAWSTTEPFTYTSWAVNEPATGGLEFCAAVSLPDGEWYAIDCATPLAGYICEQDGVGYADADLDGTARVFGDCDDSTAFIEPGHFEDCDSYDNDCDGITDPGCP